MMKISKRFAAVALIGAVLGGGMAATPASAHTSIAIGFNAGFGPGPFFPYGPGPYIPGPHYGPGPFGPGPHYGPGPFGPGPHFGPGPRPFGPGPFGPGPRPIGPVVYR